MLLTGVLLLVCCSIPESTQATATFLAKADGTVAGISVANMVFDLVDPTLNVSWQLKGAVGHTMATNCLCWGAPVL